MRSLDRFWSKVDVRGPEDCWEWKKARYHDDYGMLGLAKPDGRKGTMRAHAFALVLATGEDQGGRYALHTCDNPPCCNPAHLYWGNQKRNIKDMDERGRRVSSPRRGEFNYNAKLTELDVLKIRELYAAGGISQTALGLQFGIKQAQVSHIVRGGGWSGVSGTVTRTRDRYRISKDQADELRRLHAAGDVTQRELAAFYGISQSAVSHVVRGNTWR